MGLYGNMKARISARRSSTASTASHASMESEPSSQAAAPGPFGRALALEPLAVVDGLTVPAVLAALWTAFDALGPAALECEGIFRLSADMNELTRVKAALARAGDEPAALAASLAAVDAYCLAALIKAYLRELPDDLWLPVRAELSRLLLSSHADVGELSEPSGGGGGGGSAAHRLVAGLDSRRGAVVKLAVRLMARVHAAEPTNRMGIGAISTVFAPGLVRPEVRARRRPCAGPRLLGQIGPRSCGV